MSVKSTVPLCPRCLVPTISSLPRVAGAASAADVIKMLDAAAKHCLHARRILKKADPDAETCTEAGYFIRAASVDTARALHHIHVGFYGSEPSRKKRKLFMVFTLRDLYSTLIALGDADERADAKDRGGALRRVNSAAGFLRTESAGREKVA